jgi:hypothetical protein
LASLESTSQFLPAQPLSQLQVRPHSNGRTKRLPEKQAAFAVAGTGRLLGAAKTRLGVKELPQHR